MEKLVFSTGIEEFSLENGCVLRVNPRDPSVLGRFLELEEKFSNLKPRGQTLGEKWADADSRCRQMLAEVFPGNDFFQLLGPGNCLAMCENGVSVMGNFLVAVEGILERGVRSVMEEAVARAKERREE